MMPLETLLWIFLAPFVILLSHWAGTRLGLGENTSPQKCATFYCLTVGTLLILIMQVRLRLSPLALLASSVLIAEMAHIYFHFFNMSESARRIRILIHCYQGKPIPPNTHNNEDLFLRRIARLENVGAIRKDGSRYCMVRGWLYGASLLVNTFNSLLYPERTGG